MHVIGSMEPAAMDSQIRLWVMQNEARIRLLFYSSSVKPPFSILHSCTDRGSDTWQWMMDNEENGKLQPFARVKLTRK